MAAPPRRVMTWEAHFLRSWTTDEASSGTEDSSSQKVFPGWGSTIGPRPELRCRAGPCYCHPLRRFLRWSSAAPAVAPAGGGFCPFSVPEEKGNGLVPHPVQGCSRCHPSRTALSNRPNRSWRALAGISRSPRQMHPTPGGESGQKKAA